MEDIQIILVDDGSTDCSMQICEQLALSDSRIEVYHIENSGSVVARKYGLEKERAATSVLQMIIMNRISLVNYSKSFWKQIRILYILDMWKKSRGVKELFATMKRVLLVWIPWNIKQNLSEDIF